MEQTWYCLLNPGSVQPHILKGVQQSKLKLKAVSQNDNGGSGPHGKALSIVPSTKYASDICYYYGFQSKVCDSLYRK